MNGTIRAMAGAGVSISNGRVERLTVSDNRRAILVRYTGSVTTDETFRNGGLVVGNRISGNAGEGISCVACTVIGNTVLNNGSVGLFAEAVAYGENLFWGNNSNGTQVELHEHSASGSSRQTAANSCNGSPCPD